jgi:ubiquinone/menaquinone biosynthesis C-methylase UbiE
VKSARSATACFGDSRSDGVRYAVGDHMAAYYERRAREYDDWWLSEGQFANRPRRAWAAEVRDLLLLVAHLRPGRVLDVGCGTAFLTRHLRGELTALDRSPSMVEIAQRRLPDARVLLGNAVPLPFDDGEFDRVFTSHFYGHLLEDERTGFLEEARRVADEVVVVDAALRDDVLPAQWQERRLDDGSQHRVYKRYFTPDELAGELGGSILYAGRWFLVARAEL